jgi:hypothetical protein
MPRIAVCSDVRSQPDAFNREPTTLQGEMWSNTYKVFVLIWVAQRERLKRRPGIIVPRARAA